MTSERGFAVWACATLILVLFDEPASGLPYPCPTDPGFCYRDIGNDGCFDVGTDTGPINADIMGSSSCLPTVPGSIVCPPSVEELTATVAFPCLETNPGSSILIYSAKIEAFYPTFNSGDRILLGGTMQSAGTFTAEGDLLVEKGFNLKEEPHTLQSTNGNVTIGAKARIRSGGVSIQAAGDVSLLDRATLILGIHNQPVGADLTIDAGGAIQMTRAKIKIDAASSSIVLKGSQIMMHDRLSLRAVAPFSPQNVDITATSGDVTIDRLILKTSFPTTISGTNVTIGVMQDGVTPRSSINQALVNVEATDVIHIDNLRLRSPSNGTFQTDGATIEVFNSDFVGTNQFMPTFFVTANAAGSTCDLTATEVAKATLVTNCDNVIGP
jgi:hypothetical protein